MPIELPVEFTFPNVASAAQKALQKLDQNVRGSSVGLKDIAKTAAVVATAFAAAGASVKVFLDGITDVIDESHTLAASVDTTADVIQGLRQAARATGKDLKQVVPLDFAKRLRQAGEGSKTLEKAFKDAGVNIRDTEGNLKDFRTALGDTIDGLNENVEGTERAALASEIFGRKAKDMLTVFKDSAALDAYIAQAQRFGIDVGPEATKASGDWQKANANLSLSFDNAKQTLLDLTGGQEAWNEAINNASVNIVFFTEIAAGMFDILFTNVDAAVSNVLTLGDAFARLLSGETDFTVELKEGIFDPVDAISGVLNKAANSAIDFRKHIELTSVSGERGFRGTKEAVDDLGGSLDDIVELFDFSSVLEADIALSKVMGEQWLRTLDPVERINAEFDKQALAIKTLVAEGADRERGAEALAQLQVERVLALSEEAGLQSDIADIEARRKENTAEALSIAQATVGAISGVSALTAEIWATNQANNRELEYKLQLLRRQTRDKTDIIDAEVESLELQLEATTNAQERAKLEHSLKALKEDIAVIDEDSDKRADRLKKLEEERLEDTFADVKKLQIAATNAAGAVAVVQALAQLGPIAGAVAATGIVATTIAQSLALIRSQSPSFHIGGNPFEDQPLPGFSNGPDERQVTVTQNEIQSPADRRNSEQAPTMFELPIMLSSQVIDTLVFEVATGSGRTGKLIRGGTDVLRRPVFTGN